jgi:hypothetical protein
MSAKTRAPRKPAPPQPTPEELMALGVIPHAPGEADPPARLPPLLRYLPGKSPLYLGVNHVRR